MDGKAIKNLIVAGENDTVEFKRARGGVPADFWPSYSSFANTDGGTSDARNGKIFNIFSLVRIGERSGMGISSLYGVWKQEKFAQPSIAESYEPDRTKVTVEYESESVRTGGGDLGSGGRN